MQEVGFFDDNAEDIAEGASFQSGERSCEVAPGGHNQPQFMCTWELGKVSLSGSVIYDQLSSPPAAFRSAMERA